MSQRSFNRSHQRRLLAQARRDELRRRVGLATTAALGATALLASSAQAATYTVTATTDGAANGAACVPGTCTLRDAITAANASAGADTITFASNVTGVITLTEGVLPLSDDTTITGPGSQALAISGNDVSRIFDVQSPAQVTLTGLELTRGRSQRAGGVKYSGGGGAVVVRSGAALTARGDAFTSNVAARDEGGAILSGGTLRVENSTFSGNTSPQGSGGAVAQTNQLVPVGNQKYTSRPLGTLTVSGSSFTGNSAQDGGAIASFAGKYDSATPRVAPAAGDVTVTGSTITTNTASYGVGGLSISQTRGGNSFTEISGRREVATGEATVRLSDTTVTGNVGRDGGGASLTAGQGAAFLVERATVTGNESSGDGGGIASASTVDGKVAIQDSTVSGNTAEGSGGGLDGSTTGDAELSVERTRLTGNTAGGAGGGARVTANGASGASLTDSTISGNVAGTAEDPAEGGGVLVGAVNGDSTVDVSRSTLSGNRAPEGTGGGLSVADQVEGALSVTQSTLTDNTAATGGGAAIASSQVRRMTRAGRAVTGSIAFEGDTISGNAATTRGGGLELGRTATYTYDEATETGSTTYGSLTQPLRSTVVSGNTAAGRPADFGQQPITDGGSGGGGFVLSHSLVQTPGDVPFTTDPAAPSITGVDPQLGTLADNGGPTQTLLPAAASALIDAGKATAGTTTDQRGAARTVDLAKADATGGDGTDIGAVEVGAPAPQTPAAGAPAATAPTPAQPAKVVPAAPTPPPVPSSTLRVTSVPGKPLALSQKGGRRITLRGNASAGTTKVRIAVAYKTGSKCRFLRTDGTFSAKRDCRRTLYVTAKGTRRWSLKLPKLRSGRYTVWSRAIGPNQVERKATNRNFKRFTIK